MTNPYEAWAAAIDAAQPLYDRAILLGYNVSASTHTEDDRTDVSFWVRRFDLPSGNERTFSTVDEVSQYLDSVAELQRYSLELVGNPRVRTEPDPDSDGFATWIVDTHTGERFGVRTQDLEAITTLHIHAEDQPTIGNWEPN